MNPDRLRLVAQHWHNMAAGALRGRREIAEAGMHGGLSDALAELAWKYCEMIAESLEQRAHELELAKVIG